MAKQNPVGTMVASSQGLINQIQATNVTSQWPSYQTSGTFMPNLQWQGTSSAATYCSAASALSIA